MNAPDRPEPVRIKLYGLLSMTRRGYLAQLITGIVLLVSLFLAWYAFWPYRRLEPRAGGMGVTIWLMHHLPWLLLILGLLFAVEAVIVLRRFRRAEARRSGSAGPQPPNPPPA